MADCFSLPNAAELVEEKRNYARAIGSITLSCGEMNILAGAYENILAENAKLKAERDAAVEDLKSAADESGECWGCEFMDLRKQTCIHLEKMICSKNNSKWKWRGVQDG